MLERGVVLWFLYFLKIIANKEHGILMIPLCVSKFHRLKNLK